MISRIHRGRRVRQRRTFVPGDDGKVVGRLGPLNLLGLGLQLLHLHGENTLLDLVLGERLELGCETEGRCDEDEPLGRVAARGGEKAKCERVAKQ